ncbi:uncharacterized protein KZ484_015289 [Pholidichthys leucotaenia]
MWALLGMLLVSVVSGNEEPANFTGLVGGNVLLQCNCPSRNVGKLVKWQMEDIKPMFEYINKTKFFDGYEDRLKIYVDKDSNNCSVLLTNIKEEDQGKYRCIYHNPEYNYTFVNLHVNVSASSANASPFKAPVTPQPYIRKLCKVIPSVFALGVILALFCCWILSKHRKNMQTPHRRVPDGQEGGIFLLC